MIEFDPPGLRKAIDCVAALLWQGAVDDAANGPRWRRLTLAELDAHEAAHRERATADLTSRDDVTGYPDAAHAAARALMRLQIALETIERESPNESAVDRYRNHRAKSG